MVARHEYPRLRDFIALVFHPDWRKTSRSCIGATDAEISGGASTRLERVASESAALIASRATDEQIARWLGLIGCYVILSREGYTARSFIGLIGDRIRAKR